MKSILSKNIKKLRLFKGLNQEEFGTKLKVKRSSIGAYEEGRAEPKLEVIIRISNLFELPVDDIVKKELTVNQIAKFKLPEESTEDFASMIVKMSKIDSRLGKIEKLLKELNSK